ncbi:predicted protein [Pyrenophora tritici-repentis Pt-1C-BFP]|uniref:Uncharacterized protein n=1 Tax=Pyrenophora tritici-repentis (strain Pt-1C-BFP) TaxID=426418 RepID=B2VTQ3_PYRTR|nr:uncharacterized protein PTRG_00898 [Pyrenophora tritici-repentis Pt-1C-BFP]EDU40336.1 predicted protein [Pyrenophora tritici-repentis Pt-1C-BFP]
MWAELHVSGSTTVVSGKILGNNVAESRLLAKGSAPSWLLASSCQQSEKS